MANTKLSGTSKNWNRYYCAEVKYEELINVYTQQWLSRHDIVKYRNKGDLIRYLSNMRKYNFRNSIRNFILIDAGEYRLEPTGETITMQDIP